MPQILSPDTQVLIVDDNSQYAMLLDKLLRGVFGFTVVDILSTPEEALKLLEADPQKYRLLFVDYNLEASLTGTELLAKLSELSILDGKASFLITAEPSADNLKAAKAAGAIGVVAKPFDRAELGRQLEKADRLMLLDDGESF